MTSQRSVGRKRGEKDSANGLVYTSDINARSVAIEKLAAKLFPTPNPMPTVFPSASEMINLSRTLK